MAGIPFAFYSLCRSKPLANTWHGNCLNSGRRTNQIMPRFLNAALLGAALIIPVAIAPLTLRAEDQKARTYHDKQHNDDHAWNSHEDKAYRMYAKENHRKYSAFATLNENDQQAYNGAGGIEHSDAAAQDRHTLTSVLAPFAKLPTGRLSRPSPGPRWEPYAR